MFGEMFPTERATALSQLMQRPEAPPGAPGFFQGTGGALVDILPNAALTTGSAWSPILDAYGKSQSYADAVTGTDQGGMFGGFFNQPKSDDELAKIRAETISKIGDNQMGPAFRQEAQKWAPDPLAVGTAGKIVFGVGTSLAKAAAYSPTGPAAPYLFGADIGLNRAAELKDQGVDPTTANIAGLMTGVVGAAGLKMPAALGATRLQSAGIGAVVNPALNVAETGGIRLLLQHANYDQIAQQYQPFDPVNLTVAAIVGGAFGAAFHAGTTAPAGERIEPTLTPEQHAAALTMNDVRTREGDTLTSLDDITASNAAADAQELARRQLDNGEMVSVANDVPTDPRQIQAQASRVRERLNEGEDALLGQPLDFGDRTIADLETQYAGMTDEAGRNLTDNGHVIDADLVRELSPDYQQNRLRSPDIHDAASALTKELYARALARPVAPGRDNTVLFLAGGGGSGKSSVLRNAFEENTNDITMDGTFSNLSRARNDVQAALDSGRDVKIVYVYRHPEQAIENVIDRAAMEGRTVPVDALARAHAGAPEVVKTIAREYNGDSRVEIDAFDNSGRHESDIRSIPIEDIPHVDENQARVAFARAIEAAHDAGKISGGIYRSLRGEHFPIDTAHDRSLPQGRPEQQALDAVTSATSNPSFVAKVVDSLSQLIGAGKAKPPQTEPSLSLKPETPEQARAFEAAARNPDALIPTVDAAGNETQVRAADLIQHAADIEKTAKTETAAFDAAVNCALRYPNNA